MRKVFCDRCDCEIGDYDKIDFSKRRFNITYKTEGENNQYTSVFSTSVFGNGIDLCEKCEEELEHWMFRQLVIR